jgi:hypothetical protein
MNREEEEEFVSSFCFCFCSSEHLCAPPLVVDTTKRRKETKTNKEMRKND